ncbi:MAG: PAS domain S-box protein, partial [Cyanobacteria bacterium J06636_27]
MNRVQQALLTSAFKLRNNNLVLTQLARNSAIYNGDLTAALKKITQAAASNIEVGRASFWLYEDDDLAIRRVDLFDSNSNSHVEEISIRVADYPVFFKFLNADEIIATNNAFLDLRTQDLREIYLQPNNIKSLFCIPVRLSGITAGMLCLETVEEIRSWTQEDLNFGRALGNLISLTLEARNRKFAEAERGLSEQKLASAFRSSPDPIVLSTFPDSTYIEVNDSYCELFNCTREQVIGSKASDLNIWHNLQQCNDLVKLLVADGKIRNQEVDFRISDQEIRTTLLSAELIEINQQQYVLATARDITKLKQSQHILQESERRFRAIFNSSFGFTALLQPNGKLISLNQTALNFFGLKESEVVDLPFWSSFADKICCSQENLRAAIETAANGEFIRSEVDIIGEFGIISTIDCSIKPIFDEKNQVVLLILEGRDIQ